MEHTIGNDKVGELADRGSEEHIGSRFLERTHWISKRQIGYAKFMGKVHHVIIVVLKT